MTRARHAPDAVPAWWLRVACQVRFWVWWVSAVSLVGYVSGVVIVASSAAIGEGTNRWDAWFVTIGGLILVGVLMLFVPWRYIVRNGALVGATVLVGAAVGMVSIAAATGV